MPSHIIPRRQSLHRIACIALYRATLEQCPRITIPDNLKQLGPVDPLKHLIRKRFRAQIHNTSPRQCVQALQYGYQAEEMLRKAGDGDEAAHSQILELLSERQRQAALARARTPPPTKRTHVYPEPRAGSMKVLEMRPLPLEQLSGRRRLPIASGGNAIPFLRIGNRQSPFLSRLIKDKVEQRQRRFDLAERMDEDAEIGQAEQEWENIVGGDVYEADHKPWDAAMQRAGQEAKNGLRNEKLVSREKALRVLDIVTKERKLWEEERRARRHQKRLEKWEKKLAGKPPAVGVDN
ncbi:hypothetical protein PVAG01_07277 [Phlyctema vagabunda]|uniref:Uncharacterized protein n=1 Tax=Phlyctema vagabunda TaxID=108571 RepID=A0ABR4PCE2_9HELO